MEKNVLKEIVKFTGKHLQCPFYTWPRRLSEK